MVNQVKPERWRPLKEAHIPPITREGYEENVLQREIWNAKPVMKSKETVKSKDAYLIRLSTNERIDLNKDDFIIGKSKEADYKIEGNAAISRNHVKIARKGAVYTMEDLGSLNHTYVDDVMVQKVREIKPGQLIKLADEAFAFFVEEMRNSDDR